MTPAARNLLALLAIRDIPIVKCDLRPKVELLRRGYACGINELTNTLSERGGNTFVRRMLHITEDGRAADTALKVKEGLPKNATTD